MTMRLDQGRRDRIFEVVGEVRANVVDDVGDLLVLERFAGESG
jgi:RNA-binding protein YhbY